MIGSHLIHEVRHCQTFSCLKKQARGDWERSTIMEGMSRSSFFARYGWDRLRNGWTAGTRKGFFPCSFLPSGPVRAGAAGQKQTGCKLIWKPRAGCDCSAGVYRDEKYRHRCGSAGLPLSSRVVSRSSVQPPPSALMRATLAVIRLCMICRAVCSFERAVAWAVTTVV